MTSGDCCARRRAPEADMQYASCGRRHAMKSLDVIAAVLLVVGGLNWGLVGLAALYQAFGLRSIQRRWGVRIA